MATTQPGTEYEALMAALLGNVGKVREEIQRLPAELRGSVAPTITALNKTMVDAQASLKVYAKGMEPLIKGAATEQLALVRQAFTETASATLAAVALDLKKATALHQQAISETSGTSWKYIVLMLGGAALAGLIAGVTVLGGYHFWYAAEVEKNTMALQFGKAFFAADLDQKARDKVQDAVYEQGTCRKEKEQNKKGR